MTVATVSKAMIDAAHAVNLITLAGQYTKLKQASGTKEYMGPCPKCGGTDRLHVKFGGFFCRQCKPLEANNGIWYDQVDWARWMDGCGFVEAVERLTGAKPMTITKTPVTPVVKQQKPSHEHYTGWLEKAEVYVAEAHRRLMGQVWNSDGGEYLLGRGIEPHAWEAFGLGFAPEVALPGTWDAKTRQHTHAKQPAIVIPWYRGGKLTAVRYRFLTTHEYTDLDGKARKVKTTSMHDSDFSGLLYGGQALMGCAEDVRTLVLCEGELNAISIWQMAEPWNWDVLSLGSESAKLTPAMLAYAAKFERVIIWMDRPELVKELMAQIPGSYGISSAVVDGVKQDANKLLQTEQLGGLLTKARWLACKTEDEQRRLFYNINDAIARRHMDLGACEVIAEIAAKVGIKL
jgi:hypothetical protein